MLSEFGTGKQTIQSPSSLSSPPPPPPPTATTTTSGIKGRLRTNTRVDAPPESVPGSTKKSQTTQLDSTTEEDEADDVLSSDDFARELAREMENLVREIAGEPGSQEPGASGAVGDGAKDDEEERARAFKAAWEAMLVEGMDGNLGEDGLPIDPSSQKAAGSSTSGSGAAGAGTSFQDKIKQTMDKLKESESKFQVCYHPSPISPSHNPISLTSQFNSRAHRDPATPYHQTLNPCKSCSNP